MEKPISQLPTQNIANLLDRHGIEHTWKSLLYTHAAVTHSQKLDTNFTIFAEDVLKDLSIGNISVLYEFSLAHVNVQNRKKEGQFFTPDDVALKMVDFTSQFPPGGIWLDPCSGVGNLAFHLVQKHNNPADFMMNYLYLVDKDPLALWIARFLLAAHAQRQRDILIGRQVIEQAKILEDDADAPAQHRQLVARDRRNLAVEGADDAARRLERQEKQAQKRRLAGAGRPRQELEGPARNIEGQVAEDLRPHPVAQSDILEMNQWPIRF